MAQKNLDSNLQDSAAVPASLAALSPLKLTSTPFQSQLLIARSEAGADAVNTVAVEAVDHPKSGGDELVSGITMSKSWQEKDVTNLDSSNSNGTVTRTHREADDHPGAAGGTHENSAVNIAAVEAVDCPESGGDELVSGITMPKNFQQLQDLLAHPVQTEQQGTYDFV